MLRRRRVLFIALLLVVLGAGGGYRLAYGGGPSPVLRTVTVGLMPGMVAVDAATNRAFVNNYQDQSVSLLSASSGTVLRTVLIGVHTAALMVDVPTQRLFVYGDDNNNVSLLDATSGAPVGATQAAIFNSGAVDPRTGHLFGATSAGEWAFGNTVEMFNGRTGALLQSAALAGNQPKGMAVDARTDRVFSADAGDNTASMLQASSLRLLRTVKVGPVPVVVAVDVRRNRVFIPNTGGNTVSVLDARNGAVLRTIVVAPHPAAAVVDERTDRVFLVHGHSITKGVYSSLMPTFQQVGPIGVTVLDARTGAVLRTLPVGGSTADDEVGWTPITTLAVDVRRNRVFVINRFDPSSTSDGSVSVLDARTGGLLRTIGVGRHPISLAVDEATARLFVVNTNAGCLRPFSLWDRVPAAVRHVVPFLPVPPMPTCNMPGTVTVIDTSRL